MRAFDSEHNRSVAFPRIAASRAASIAPRAVHSHWDTMVVSAVPAAAPQPADIRALAFAASIGPSRSPRSAPDADDVVIDLAGEEALVEYLVRLMPVGID